MVKTTVYLPDDLKQALTSAARSNGVSEAELIRGAIRALVGERTPERRSGFLSGTPFARQAEDLLAGFGER